MNFVDLIEEAKMDGCSDVHITVGTSIARRRYGKLEMLEPIPTAQESTTLILETLTEDQIRRIR